ncbi:MAG: hypothetical protein CMB57_07030 [Euryarchaeota archaeon]|nr:hypothetical protein [Euryarchaeota archaeon]|tara:strand:+ start:14581 stop:15618 length:1038 start_codon:yes stop_codon:yes gene_type:complete
MRSQRKSDSDLAVSEVIGVVMLLAMVITMMGGVFVFLTPYVNDFQDNTAWSNANGIAERLDGRIDVVAGASADTGLRTTIPLTMSSISPIISAEVWTVSADLTAEEIVTVEYINQTTFSVTSENETADRAIIWTESGEVEITFNETYEEVLITHNLSVADIYIVTIFDGENEIHKHAKIPISGLMVKTKVQTGEHSIGLLNDARYDKFSDETWSITSFPDMNIEELFDGTMRASLSLRDVDTAGAIPDGRNAVFDVRSEGPITLFSGDAWNFRFTFESSLGPTVAPQMTEGWLTDYNLHRASNTLDQHRGISPWLRASGIDGLTIDHGNSVIDLEIELQLVEVSK